MVSEIGALIIEEKPSASTYVVKGNTATVSDTLKSIITSGIAGVYMEVPKALRRDQLRVLQIMKLQCMWHKCLHNESEDSWNKEVEIFLWFRPIEG